MTRAFKPGQSATVSISCTTTTARAAITGAPGAEFQVRLYNAGSATVFVARGGSAVDATTSSMPLPAGAIEVITCEAAVTHVAAITSSGTATLYITTGSGL